MKILLPYQMNWWKGKTQNSKGGSFNLELYLRILEIKNE